MSAERRGGCGRRKYLAGKVVVSFVGSAQGQQPTQFVGRYDESSLAAPGADKPVKTQRMPHDRKQMHCEGLRIILNYIRIYFSCNIRN